MGKLYIVVTFYLTAGCNIFDLFCQKLEIDYNYSTENSIVAKVATISDDDDDIDEPIPKQTGVHQICSSLMGLSRNLSTA